MLARISGGTGGIREYLEDGRKAGREFSRNELDTRVPLQGDLAMTDRIIESMTNEGEKYLHVTLSFREDHISTETLQAIISDFKEFAFSAYQEDEYNLYAEAHLPRIKSYEHARTGELIERKPHIHIVIPEKNLLSGTALNPFGKVDQQTPFLEAFQEHVNAKYGLASPKDHARDTFTPASEMLSRYKGDMFDTGADVKQRVLDAVLEREVETMPDFRALMAEHGTTLTRNAGKANAYEHLKPDGAKRGMNFRERVFTPAFIELPTNEKRAVLAKEAAAHYQGSKAPRPSAREIESKITEWHDLRAKQIKYINSGNRKLYAEFRDATPENKREILARREAAFYQKHRQEITHERSNQRGRVAHLERDLRAASRHIEAASGRARDPEHAKRFVADRRAIRALGAALERHVPGQETSRHSVRVERQPGNVTGRYARDVAEVRLERGRGQGNEMAEIKQGLDARRLLAQVSHTHGVVPGKYEVTKAKDGSDRIRCGARNLNVSDFLTKELNLPFDQAAPILREAYAKQTGRAQIEPKTLPRQELWKEYSQQWRPARAKTVQADRSAVVDQRRVELQRNRDVTRQRLAAIQGDRKLTREARAALKSVAKMEKVGADVATREKARRSLEVVDAGMRRRPADLYREFLTEKANAGDTHALAELRRQRHGYEREDAGNQATAKDPREKGRDALDIGRLTYRVAHNGEVTYRDGGGRDVLRDEGRKVAFLSNDAHTIETGLRLAGEKFGKEISLHGTDEFKRAAVRIAVQENLNLKFADPKLEAMKRQVEAEREAGRAVMQRERAEAALAKDSVLTIRGTAPATIVERPLETELKVDGKRAIVERIDALHIVSRSEAVAVQSLRIAKEKFGGIVEVTGEKADKENLVRLSVKHQIDVQFKDPSLNAMRRDLQLQRSATLERNTKDRGPQNDLSR